MMKNSSYEQDMDIPIYIWNELPVGDKDCFKAFWSEVSSQLLMKKYFDVIVRLRK